MSFPRLVFFAFVATLAQGCSEYRGNEEEIRESLLREFPLGSTYDVVSLELTERLVTKSPLFLLKDRPCLRSYLVPLGEGAKSRNRVEEIGVSSIRVELGWYFDPVFPTYVFSQWCFDENEDLIDIVIQKEKDSL